MARSTRVLLITVFLVLCAGVVVGRLSARLVPSPIALVPPRAPRPATLPAPHQGSWLADQLDLSPAQHQQMDAIWADTKQRIDKTWEQRRELDRQRDGAIHDLLTPSQQAAYQKIYDDYHGSRQTLDKQRDELVKDAEDRSRAMLSETQKSKWDALAKEMHQHRGARGMGGPPSTQGWHGMRGGPGPDEPPPPPSAMPTSAPGASPGASAGAIPNG